ncbi:MAG TPA: diaminopimelate epimerase [Bryobacteraceae bacterium]|nr:diaminopimelate epimerase [Bryobacteraceae bacterium]
MRIPFTKAHGAGNDFALTWASDAPSDGLPETARALCDRHTGVGADGWLLVRTTPGGRADAEIRLFNADGSEPELSGNGTRCAAAFLLDMGVVSGSELRIATGAGVKHLRLVDREGRRFTFEMNMGQPAYAAADLQLQLPLDSGMQEVVALSVGNPQCVVFVENFDFDWRRMGVEIERYPHFPNRTNVSFVRRIDAHTLEVRFFERGVGETISSGTGSTGAMAAAILRGVAESPVRIVTPAGPIDLRWDDDLYLTGPAEIVAAGEFYADRISGEALDRTE